MPHIESEEKSVATTIKRTAFDPIRTFTEHLALKAEGSRITKRSEALKKRLKDYLPTASETYENENGSVFLDLPDTVEVEGKAYKGMELRRSVSTKFQEDEAEKILRRKGVLEEALSTYIDQDKIYRLVQEGKISERDLDKMFTDEERFAFWPVEGEVL